MYKMDKERLYLNQKGRCNLCNGELDTGSMDIDHIIRKKDGGSDDIKNKQLLCVACHRQKTADENRVKRSPRNLDEFHDHLSAMMSRSPMQNHRPKNVGQLYQSFKQGQLLLADLNRTPVWTTAKKSDYILALLEGKVTPPLFFNKKGMKCYIYDGGNRFHAIKEFFEGDLYVRLKGNFKGVYRMKKKGDDDTYEFNGEERNLFENISVDVFEWDNLGEGDACELALRLNQGVVMNVSERLKLELAQNTCRARLIREVYEGDLFTRLKAKVPRENLLKTLIVAVRALTDEDRTLENDEKLRPHYDTLANFLRGTESIANLEELKCKLCAAAQHALRNDDATCDAFYTALKLYDRRAHRT